MRKRPQAQSKNGGDVEGQRTREDMWVERRRERRKTAEECSVQTHQTNNASASFLA